MFDQQLTLEGGAEDIAPATRQEKLFQPVRVMAGQTSMHVPPTNPVAGCVFPSCLVGGVGVCKCPA